MIGAESVKCRIRFFAPLGVQEYVEGEKTDKKQSASPKALISG